MEKEFHVSVSLAETIGLNESILLLALKKQIEKRGTLIEGERWVDITYANWQTLFPFWSISTIKRIVSSLKTTGFIEVKQLRKTQYDRTNWYRLTKKAKEMLLVYDEKEPFMEELDNAPMEIKEKCHQVYEYLRKKSFYPLKKDQWNELKEVCEKFSLTQIYAAIEQTVARSVYAWKYVYKILTNKQRRTPIRKEPLPDWFWEEEETIDWEQDEEFLKRKKRLEAIQQQLREKKNSLSFTHLI